MYGRRKAVVRLPVLTDIPYRSTVYMYIGRYILHMMALHVCTGSASSASSPPHERPTLTSDLPSYVTHCLSTDHVYMIKSPVQRLPL